MKYPNPHPSVAVGILLSTLLALASGSFQSIHAQDRSPGCSPHYFGPDYPIEEMDVSSTLHLWGPDRKGIEVPERQSDTASGPLEIRFMLDSDGNRIVHDGRRRRDRGRMREEEKLRPACSLLLREETEKWAALERGAGRKPVLQAGRTLPLDRVIPSAQISKKSGHGQDATLILKFRGGPFSGMVCRQSAENLRKKRLLTCGQIETLLDPQYIELNVFSKKAASHPTDTRGDRRADVPPVSEKLEKTVSRPPGSNGDTFSGLKQKNAPGDATSGEH